jgi:hypothetical protein
MRTLITRWEAPKAQLEGLKAEGKEAILTTGRLSFPIWEAVPQLPTPLTNNSLHIRSPLPNPATTEPLNQNETHLLVKNRPSMTNMQMTIRMTLETAALGQALRNKALIREERRMEEDMGGILRFSNRIRMICRSLKSL